MRKYNLNENFFDELNKKSAYWLGFLYADGYVRMKDGKSGEMKLKLKETDKGHIEKFLKDIECDKPIKCGVDGNSKFCSVTIYSNYLVNKLFYLGCVNNKTFKIIFPNIDLNLIKHFVRGYFDGDGCISKIKNKWYHVSIAGNEQFITSLKKFLLDSGVYKLNIYPSNKIKILSITNLTDVFKFKNIIYDDDTVFLERKKNKFNEVVKNFVSKEEFCDLVIKNNLTTFNKYVSYITYNKLSRFPRNPESEYNFKF
jgi:DNA-binding transcriptional regulator WhiA